MKIRQSWLASRYVLLLAAMFLVASSLILTQPVSAEIPATLAGELLVADPIQQVMATCDPAGTSTISFAASGIATGPYPGTFQESGTITIGPQLEPGANGLPEFSYGPIISVQTSFEILSGDTRITGTKSFQHSDLYGDGEGICTTT